MTTSLRAELKQTRPFGSLEQEVFLNVLRTADHLLRGEVEVLREADLTFAQYNVLRILRGAGRDGITCGGISERMVTRDSDITRLLDRLEARGLVERVRDARDRRAILSRITKTGLALLEELDEPVAAVHTRQFRHMTRTQLQSLGRLLEIAREGHP
jgi:DNA-binding MarR family transcriptional regulator